MPCGSPTRPGHRAGDPRRVRRGEHERDEDEERVSELRESDADGPDHLRQLAHADCTAPAAGRFVDPACRQSPENEISGAPKAVRPVRIVRTSPAPARPGGSRSGRTRASRSLSPSRRTARGPGRRRSSPRPCRA